MDYQKLVIELINWRIIKEKHSFHFFLCRTKGYSATKFAECHFELAAKELGLKGGW